MTTTVSPIPVRKTRSSSIVEYIHRQNTETSTNPWSFIFSLSSLARWTNRSCRKRKFKEWEKNLYDLLLFPKLMNPDILNEYTIEMFFERGVEFSWSLGIFLASFWWPFIFLGWSLSNCVLFFLRLYRVYKNSKKYKQAWLAIIQYRIRNTVLTSTNVTMIRDMDEHSTEQYKEQESLLVHRTVEVLLFLQSIMSFPVAIFLIISIIPFTIMTNQLTLPSGSNAERLLAIISIIEPYILSCLLLPPITTALIEIGILHIGCVIMAKRISNGVRQRAVSASSTDPPVTETEVRNSTIFPSSTTSLLYPSWWKTMKSTYAYVYRILLIRTYSYIIAIECFVLYNLFRNPGTTTGMVLTNIFFILCGTVISIFGLSSILIFIVWFRSHKGFLKQSWEHEILLDEENEILERQQQQLSNEHHRQRRPPTNITVSNPMHVRHFRTTPNQSTVFPTPGIGPTITTSNPGVHRSPFRFASSATANVSLVIRPQIVRERTSLFLNTVRKNNSLISTYWFTGSIITVLGSLLFIDMYAISYQPFTTQTNIDEIISTIIKYDTNQPAGSNAPISRLLHPSAKLIGYYMGIQLVSMIGLVLLARTIQEIWDCDDTFSRWITRNTLMNNQQYQQLTKVEEDNQRGLRIPLYLEKINDGKYQRTPEDSSIYPYGIQIIPNPIHEIKTILDNRRSVESNALANNKDSKESKLSEESKHLPTITDSRILCSTLTTTTITVAPSSLLHDAATDKYVPTTTNSSINEHNRPSETIKLPFVPSLQSSIGENDLVLHDNINHHHHPYIIQPRMVTTTPSHPQQQPLPPPPIVTISEEDNNNNNNNHEASSFHFNGSSNRNNLMVNTDLVSPRPRLFLSKVSSPLPGVSFRRGISTLSATVSMVSSSSTVSTTTKKISQGNGTTTDNVHSNGVDNPPSIVPPVTITTTSSSNTNQPTTHLRTPQYSSATYTSRIQNRGNCFICYERLADTVFMECGHSGVCYCCAEVILKGHACDLLPTNSSSGTRITHSIPHRRLPPSYPDYSYGSRTSYYDSDTEGIPPSLLYSSDNHTTTNGAGAFDDGTDGTMENNNSQPYLSSNSSSFLTTAILPLRTGGSRICPICRGPVSQILHIGPDIRTIDGKTLTIVLPRQYWERSGK